MDPSSFCIYKSYHKNKQARHNPVTTTSATSLLHLFLEDGASNSSLSKSKIPPHTGWPIPTGFLETMCCPIRPLLTRKISSQSYNLDYLFLSSDQDPAWRSCLEYMKYTAMSSRPTFQNPSNKIPDINFW